MSKQELIDFFKKNYKLSLNCFGFKASILQLDTKEGNRIIVSVDEKQIMLCYLKKKGKPPLVHQLTDLELTNLLSNLHNE